MELLETEKYLIFMTHDPIVFTQESPILSLRIYIGYPVFTNLRFTLVLYLQPNEPLNVVFEFFLFYIIGADEISVENFCLFAVLKGQLIHNLHYG